MTTRSTPLYLGDELRGQAERAAEVYTSDPDDLGLLVGYLGKARFVIYPV